ncbi:recombinase family protein, partial [Ruegeria sp. NA]
MNTSSEQSGENGGRPLAFSYRRFSSAQQKDGNSIKRQTEAAQEWCDENGYELSSSNFEDLGVSAFMG